MNGQVAVGDHWHHYGATTTRRTMNRLHWDWYQRTGPGSELLGDVAGQVVADLGSGSGHQAAHVAEQLGARQVIGIDASAAQHERSQRLYGDVNGLELAHRDVTDWLLDHEGALDAAYSLFGAVDFTDPEALLPVAAQALRPDGRLLISTLGHYRTGEPAATQCQPASIPSRPPDGSATTMPRWVLDKAVWLGLLDRHGFDIIQAETIHDPGPDGAPPMNTTVFVARRRNS